MLPEKMGERNLMRVRIWPFVSLSFCVLLLLVPLFGWIVSRKAVQIDKSASQAHRLFLQADDAITEIRAEVYRSALLLSDAAGPDERASARGRIAAFRSSDEL